MVCGNAALSLDHTAAMPHIPGMEIFRTSLFEKSLKALSKKGFTDGDLAELEARLIHDPKEGSVIKGTGGARKIRFALAGSGKSSGGRAIYYVVTDNALYLLLAYPKAVQTDLTPAQRKKVAAIVRAIKETE